MNRNASFSVSKSARSHINKATSEYIRMCIYIHVGLLRFFMWDPFKTQLCKMRNALLQDIQYKKRPKNISSMGFGDSCAFVSQRGHQVLAPRPQED